MTIFKEYAKYYDLLYSDKDYAAEAAYVLERIRAYHPGAASILDLGCGTGSHDIIFAEKGCRVTGIDRSAQSIDKARAKIVGSRTSDLRFETAEIQTVRLAQRFDAVVSLFHVMSYLTTDSDLESALETARYHLNDGGLFLFDCWYGPAVLTDPPQVRVKRVEEDGVQVIRIAEPEHLPNDNIVRVDYQVMVSDAASGKTMAVREHHFMRYWFRPEINRMLKTTGFEPVDCAEWLTGKEPGTHTWNVCFIARKRC